MNDRYQLHAPWALNVPLRAGLLVNVKKPICGGNHRVGFHQVGSNNIWGIISRDSYALGQIEDLTGETRKGQHTFTLRDRDLEPHCIKGRHAYRLALVVVRKADNNIWFRGAWVSRAAIQIPGGGKFNVRWEHFSILGEALGSKEILPMLGEAA